MLIDEALAQCQRLLALNGRMQALNASLIESNAKLIALVRSGNRLMERQQRVMALLTAEIDQLRAELRDRGDLPGRPGPA